MSDILSIRADLTLVVQPSTIITIEHYTPVYKYSLRVVGVGLAIILAPSALIHGGRDEGHADFVNSEREKVAMYLVYTANM